LSAETLVKPARFPTFAAAEPPAPPPPPKRPAVDEMATIREAARRDGLARGLEEGRAAALEEWAPRLAALAGALEETLGAARAERQRLAAEVTAVVPEVALTLARKVIEREVGDAERALRTVVAALARRVTERGVGTVRVAPEIAVALDAWRAEAGAGGLDGLAIRADDTLRPGDWIIETDGGAIDGRLGVQFDEATRILTEPEA
jgi:flagellar biosynthesis/type III secretory pathway protein FliH